MSCFGHSSCARQLQHQTAMRALNRSMKIPSRDVKCPRFNSEMKRRGPPVVSRVASLVASVRRSFNFAIDLGSTEKNHHRQPYPGEKPDDRAFSGFAIEHEPHGASRLLNLPIGNKPTPRRLQSADREPDAVCYVSWNSPCWPNLVNAWTLTSGISEYERTRV
jgi:hypothetical protein